MCVTVQTEQHEMILLTTLYALSLTLPTTSKFGFIIPILQKRKQNGFRDINQFSKDSHPVSKKRNFNLNVLLPLYSYLIILSLSMMNDDYHLRDEYMYVWIYT